MLLELHHLLWCLTCGLVGGINTIFSVQAFLVFQQLQEEIDFLRSLNQALIAGNVKAVSTIDIDLNVVACQVFLSDSEKNSRMVVVWWCKC